MRRILRQAEQYPFRVAIPEHLDRRWKEKLMDHLVHQYEHGEPMGFTLHDQLGDGPTSGTTVSYPPDEGNRFNKGVPLGDVTAEDLGQFAQQHRPKINADPNNNFGTWVENDPDDPYGRLFMDVSERVGEPHDALGKGLERDQIAVMDNDKVDHRGKPLDSAFFDPTSGINSGPASALGWTHAKRRPPR